jgi:amidophosphoribosyltransferase
MCGVVGTVTTTGAAPRAAEALFFLQKRGEAGVGIVSSDANRLHPHHQLGLVNNLDPKTVEDLKGWAAIGQVRYPTQGKADALENLQPFTAPIASNLHIAVAHNGEFTNYKSLRKRLEKEGAIFRTTSDTELVLHLIAGTNAALPLYERVIRALRRLTGSYSLLVLAQDQLIAVRDPMGIRPLVYGAWEGGVIFASEDAPFNHLGVKGIGDVAPGEMCIVRPNLDMKWVNMAKGGQPRHCSFEYAYFARPDSTINGISVWDARKAFGRALHEECTLDVDVVVPVMDSGLFSAMGYSEASGIPHDIGFVRDHYSGRSFIQSKQEDREAIVRRKLSPITRVLRGKRVALVDDSLVRGTTMKILVKLVREAGATWVGVLIPAPAVEHSCFYGIDTPRREDLAVVRYGGVEGVRKFIEADDLRFLSNEGFLRALTSLNGSGGHAKVRPPFCDACFSGHYPAPTPAEVS